MESLHEELDFDDKVVSHGIEEVSAISTAVLILLYKRTVAYYASLADVNVYHKQRVELVWKAARQVFDFSVYVLNHLSIERCQSQTTSEFAERNAKVEDLEPVFRMCEHPTANQARGI